MPRPMPVPAAFDANRGEHSLTAGLSQYGSHSHGEADSDAGGGTRARHAGRFLAE